MTDLLGSAILCHSIITSLIILLMKILVNSLARVDQISHKNNSTCEKHFISFTGYFFSDSPVNLTNFSTIKLSLFVDNSFTKNSWNCRGNLFFTKIKPSKFAGFDFWLQKFAKASKFRSYTNPNKDLSIHSFRFQSAFVCF